MDTTKKIIRGVVNGRGFTITSAITQWDYGWQFIPEIEDLPPTYRLDFSNDEHHGTALPVYCSTDGAEVPTELIDTGKDVWVWFVRIGDGYGITEYKWRVPNKCKPKTEQDEPTPSQQSSIDQAISVVNEAVESAEQSASEADQSAQSASQFAEDARDAEARAAARAATAKNHADRAEQARDDAQTYANNASASATESAQSASQSAQIKADVEELERDAQAAANSSGISARASGEFASQAQGFARQAESYANGASGYASQASESAQTASTKASEASTSASTASAKATESAQSATNASQSAQTALQAKTNAQTAQGKAEDAQTAAETAQGLAEDARDEAQNLVDGITGKVEQIDSNTERIESLEDDRYKPYAVDSASGSIASFTDGADDIPLKSLIVDINPVQDLHGYDSPWPAGGGKNLFGGAFNQVFTFPTPIPANTTLAISCAYNPETSNVRINFYRQDGSRFTNYGINTISGDKQYRVITIAEDAYSVMFDVSERAWYQIELGSTATAYVPYENICPISGWTGMQLNANGTVIPISWQTEAGTVYGGKLDVLTGKLTVYPYYASYNGETLTGEWISDRDVYAVGTTPTIGAQVVNIGAQGTEYQLTPHEVNSLLGVNNIFADTGDSAVEYRADTKLYIERLTAPEEDDMIADSAITSGQFFMIGNSLYRALANIASGATITVGTNAQRVSLSDALNLVNA